MKTETTTINTAALDALILDARRYRWLKTYGQICDWTDDEIDCEICKDDVIAKMEFNLGATS